ncbi:MAG: hypothetical protein IJR53_07080 [Bacteroidales bacterium]|nr:hypothetical protein [Bacteroidales bacterium]
MTCLFRTPEVCGQEAMSPIPGLLSHYAVPRRGIILVTPDGSLGWNPCISAAVYYESI